MTIPVHVTSWERQDEEKTLAGAPPTTRRATSVLIGSFESYLIGQERRKRPTIGR